METHPICVICGKSIHPLQATDAQPVAEGPCCVSCHYSIVYPTKMNGKPSRWKTEKNERGGYKSSFAPMNELEVSRLKKRIEEIKKKVNK